MEMTKEMKMLLQNIELATENETLKKELESAKNADSNLAYAMGASEDLEEAMEKVKSLQMTNEYLKEQKEYLKKQKEELEQRIEGLEDENSMLSSQLINKEEEEFGNDYCSWDDGEPWDTEEEKQKLLYSTDNLIHVSPNFQYVLQNASHEHMEKQAEMILKLYELVFARVAAYKGVMDANAKLFEFMENGLNKSVQ